MSEYVTKRINRGKGQTLYDVFDAETGEEVGCAFLYIGNWWANSAGSIRNRFYSKDEAIAEVIVRHESKQAAS